MTPAGFGLLARRAPFVVTLALLLAAAGAPQMRADDPNPPGSFAEELSVEVVNVEVRVTDREGEPVTGLGPDDFQLFEDGARVEIEYFDAVSVSDDERPARPDTDEIAEESTPPGAEARDPLRLILFLDQAHTHPSNRARVMGDLERFLAEDLHPDDQVMVVDHDRDLRLRQMFTTDREAVLEALHEVGEAGTFHLQSLSERRDALRELSEAASCDELEILEALSYVRRYASWLQAEAEASLEALRALIGTLRGLPGRTLLLYVSDGLELQPAADLFDALSTTCPLGSLRSVIVGETTSWNLSSAMERLTAYANAQGVTLYTFDSSGLRADGDSETGGSPSLHGQRLRAASLQGSLEFLAEQTGGKATVNANRLGPELVEAVADAGSYYSLGFHPEHRGDGEVHRIRVEVTAPHYRVRYRRQYLDLSRQDRISSRMIATLLHGAVENPLEALLEVGPAQAVEDSGSEARFHIPLRVTVPESSLTLTPEEGPTPTGRVVLYLATRDAEGSWSGVREMGLPVKSGGEDGAEARFIVGVELPPGDATVALGVRDALGGRISYLRAGIRVLGATAPGS